MPGLKIHASPTVRRADFETFTRDLELFLEAFTPQLLATWMKKDKGNLSKKLNGLEPITRNDIRDFYFGVSSVMEKLKNGVHAYQIELEMNEEGSEEPNKNLWEEVRLIKKTLQEHTIALRELKSSKQDQQDAPKLQNP